MSEVTSPSFGSHDLAAETAAAVAAVRESPQAVGPRMALFQLACVTGDWGRAKTQLETMAKLDEEATMLARVYGRLIDSEAVRARVFDGAEQPTALGQPTPWLAMLARALGLDGNGDPEAAARLRAQAREAAPANPGTVEGRPFAWLMDADPRLGPALELVVEGQYRWLPLSNLRELRAEPPKALRDLVWQPATLVLTNDSEVTAFLPVRYPGAERLEEDRLRLARGTAWQERQAGEPFGMGQRVLATDSEDVGLLDLRRLRFDPSPAPSDA